MSDYIPSHLLGDEEDDRPFDASEPVTIAAPWAPFLPHQEALYRWMPRDKIGVQAILGGWGSGKTHGAMRRLIRLFTLNPWRPCYGSRNPVAILCAPTHRVLRQSTLAHFDALMPREAVLKRRGPPQNDILLANGLRVVLHSAESDIEGLDACVVGITEIHKPAWVEKPTRYMNLLARLRDPHAKYMGMVVDGLPEAGWVRDMFDVAHKPNPNRQLILCETAANKHISAATIQTYYDACPAGSERMLFGGQWMPPQGAVYPQFDAGRHIVDQPGSHGVPCHVGIDVGNMGALVIAQEIDVEVRDMDGRVRVEVGLLVVEDIVTSNESVEAMCHRLSRTPWLFTAESKFCVDPTIRRDELQAIRTHFPQVQIVKRERGHDHFPIESGIRITQRALLDALGNVRLFMSRKIASTPRGLVETLQRYRRSDRTGEAVKDQREHFADSVRYLCCALLPPSKPEARYWKQ